MIKDKENALAGARCIIQNWLEAKESEVIHFITDESHKKEADIFELAAFCIPSLITVIPYKNIPKPPKRLNKLER